MWECSLWQSPIQLLSLCIPLQFFVQQKVAGIDDLLYFEPYTPAWVSVYVDIEGEHSKSNLQSPDHEVSPGQVQCALWQKSTSEL